MAVLQISRVQHRRGLQQDLPQLASAELGWSIDQRRLFIGNGTIAEGAPIEGVTEILTQNTDLVDVIKFYIFKGHAANFISQTGPSPSDPVIRTLQDKADDFVSVKDFGAVGDGVANDLDAIMRAVTQIYRSDQVGLNAAARRALYFPAGTYNIGSTPTNPAGVVIVPTWCRIIGAGIDNTQIVQTDANAEYVMRFSDSAGEYGINIGGPFVTLPTDISIENLMLKQNNNKDILFIDNVSTLSFRLVKFEGSFNTAPSTEPLIAYAGIKFGNFRLASSNITFDLCKFNYLGYAVVSDVSSRNVRFNNCHFTNLYTAFRLGQNSADGSSSPVNFRISNSVFENITNLAIDSYNYATGIVSSGNSFINVGNETLTAIWFRCDGNYSVYDNFDRENANNVITIGAKTIQIQANVGVTLGTATIGTGSQLGLVATEGNWEATNIILPISGVINYQLQNNNDYSATFGTLSFSGDHFTDNFNQIPTIDVTFSIQNRTLVYQNSSSGPVTLRYNINYF